ncbi:MAG: PDZ domain-containing protein [Spirochaetes bacterium]|nr:PDZ domain-containing protein [Spirochaetota bacterium]
MKKLIIVILGIFIVACAGEEFGGLGIEVPAGPEKVSKDKPFVIASVYEGGTGYQAGLKEGDIIVSVDGVPVEGLQYDYIVTNLLRGKVGSVVTLEIKRGDTLMLFRVMRGKIVLK